MRALATVVLLASLTAACDRDDEPDPTTVVNIAPTVTSTAGPPAPTPAAEQPASRPTQAPTPAPTPTSAGTVDHPPELRTGVAVVDSVIAAVLAGDRESLAAQTVIHSLRCVTEALGAGGPPQCPDGGANGTLVDRVGVVGCEGGWAPPEEIADIIESWFVPGVAASGSAPLYLYAVLEIDAERYEGYGMPGDYYAVFGFADGQGRGLSIAGDGVTHVWFGCGVRAVERWMRPAPVESEFLLGPLSR
jgi:hypothetical protein